MSEKKDRIEGREKFLANNKVKIGVLVLLLAVLLAFAAIHSEARTYESSNRTLEGKDPADPPSSWESLELKNNVVNSTLFLEYDPVGNNGSEEVEIKVTDFTVEDNRTISLDKNESKTVSLDGDAYWIVPEYNESEGNVTYRHEIVYSIQPYSLLTIPAFVLTILGIIITYSGQAEFKEKQARKREMSLMDEKMKGENKEKR